MVNEALREESTKKTLNHSLFKVQLNDFVRYNSWIFKDDGTNR